MNAPIPSLVHRGDLWQLGEHRLLCGDATNPETVEALFAGEHFALCFTSPPYSDLREYKLGTFNWHALMSGAFTQMIAHGRPDCHILVNLGLSHKNRQVDLYWLEWLVVCASMGWPLFGWYVWDKMSTRPRANDGRLAMFHEFLFHFNQKSNLANKWIKTLERHGGMSSANRLADGTHQKPYSPDKYGKPYKVPNSVIRVMSEQLRGIHTQNHPAVFPVALPEFILLTWSQPHEIVYEPFAGSGSTLIAAEHLDRRCYAIEIEPTYCDLIIERWQQKTGKQAHRITSREAKHGDIETLLHSL